MGFLLLSSGAAAMPARAAAPTLPSYTVTLTAYNAVPAQTDSNPLETASGAYSNPEVVAARPYMRIQRRRAAYRVPRHRGHHERAIHRSRRRSF